jgi:peptidylprolyl isomerase/FKBP-type peptidyl-prolyl cis-trans isomerase FklB
MNRRLALFALAAAAAALASCGKGKDNAAIADANLASGRAFLADNAKAPGVVTLPDGLQYKITRQGPGVGESPRPQDLVEVHYEGKLLNDFVFDSSYERGVPAVFKLEGLVPAWITALKMMKPGDEWTLWVPPELGYGAEEKGPIPPNSVMVFRIELLNVKRIGG